MPQIGYGQRQYRQAPPRRRTSYQKTTRRRAKSKWSMKLGAWAHARLREAQYDSVSRKVLQTGVIFFIGAFILLVATALGVTQDVGKAIESRTDAGLRYIGFSVKNVEIAPLANRVLTNVQKSEVEAIAGIIPQDNIFNVNPKEIRDRIMDLPWVENAIVRRLLPDQIQILVLPRAANALWQEGENLYFIDGHGVKLGVANPANVKGFPLVIGQNAASFAPALFDELSQFQAIAPKVYAIERVDNRRWNIVLRNGGKILLPENNTAEALSTIEKLQNENRILERDIARLDVRRPGYLLVRPHLEQNAQNKEMS